MTAINKSLCLIAAIVMAGCEKKPREEVKRLNGPDYRPPAAVTSVIHVGTAAGAGSASYAAAIGTLRQTATYGYGPKGNGIQQPHQASFGPDGSILFVDDAAPEVFRIAAEGKVGPVLPQTTPPEFQMRGPNTILALDNRHWAVADRTTRLKVFSFEGDRLVPERVVRISDATDACLIGHSIVVRGDERPLQRFNVEDGTRVRWYGQAFKHPAKLVRTLLADGLVGCRDEGTPIVTVGMAFSHIFGYAPDGTVSWVTKVEGLENKIVSAVKSERGDIGVRNEGANFDLPSRLLPLDGDRMLFQFVRIRRQPQAPTEVHSIILSARTGKGEYIGTALPAVIGGTWPRLITLNPESRAIAVQVAERFVAMNSESRAVAIPGAVR